MPPKLLNKLNLNSRDQPNIADTADYLHALAVDLGKVSRVLTVPSRVNQQVGYQALLS